MEITKQQGLLMRAVAILMVALYHVQYDLFSGAFLIERGQGVVSWFNDAAGYISQTPWWAVGLPMYFCFIGVNVFFVLSGYALMKKYQNSDKVGVKNTWRQVMKILIPYWLAHPLIHLIDWGLRWLQFKTGVIDYEIGFSAFHSWSQYAESMLLIPRWFSSEGALIFVGTWWFVGIIIQFYLLFPLLLKLFRKFRPLWVFCFCVGITLGYRLIISLYTDASPVGVNQADLLLFINFPARLAEFVLGMYLALQWPSLGKAKSVLLGAGLVALGFLTLTYVETMFVSDMLFAIGGFLILAVFTASVSGWMEKFLKLVGKKSYAIYLYHEPTLRLLLEFILPLA